MSSDRNPFLVALSDSWPFFRPWRALVHASGPSVDVIYFCTACFFSEQPASINTNRFAIATAKYEIRKQKRKEKLFTVLTWTPTWKVLGLSHISTQRLVSLFTWIFNSRVFAEIGFFSPTKHFFNLDEKRLHLLYKIFLLQVYIPHLFGHVSLFLEQRQKEPGKLSHILNFP